MFHKVKYDVHIYLGIWILAVLYAIFCFVDQSSKFFVNHLDDYNDFDDGFLFNNKKDKADNEWETILYLFKKLFIWILVSLIMSEVLRSYRYYKVLKFYQILVTVTFIQYNLGTIALLLMLFQPLLFSFFSNFYQFTTLLWLLNFACLTLISYYKQMSINEDEVFANFNNFSEKDNFLMILGLCWINLRCISYSCNSYKFRFRDNIINILSYCLYLPTVFTGPFIFYEEFKKSTEESSVHVTERISRSVRDIFRFVFWLYFLQLCLHYIYVNATSFQPQLVEELDMWSLCGYGYSMGQFFHIKYVVTYGLSTTFAKFDNISVPSLPKCIARIHLYSDMWKYFDNGLYNFLLRHIYVPTMKSKYLSNKFFASFFCFCFVYVWHGLENYILVWSVLNYIGIVMESAGSFLFKNYVSKYSYLSHPVVMRGMSCTFASPLLVMSAVSNFYFFAGTNIGNIFVYKILNAPLLSNVLLLLALYCCCQVSTEFSSRNICKKNV